MHRSIYIYVNVYTQTGGDGGMTRGADPLTGSSNAMYEPPRDARSTYNTYNIA